MAYIYVITNKINGKQYVGKTNKSIENRFKEHYRDSRKKYTEGRPLYNAMNKYGIENFEIKILEECSAEESAVKEIYWIGKLDTYGNGYNATLGGDSKKYYNYQELADAYLKLGSLISVANKYGCDSHTVSFACKECGVKVLSSQEIAKKEKSKIVLMLDKKDGSVIKEFSSTKDAGKFLGDIKKSCHISQVCTGQRKSAYGYK